MSKDWLWDRKLTAAQAKKILKDPEHKGFVLIASLLLARKNEPQKVFKEYIDPLLFCKHWAVIKKRMRKDKWSEQRIIFWQAVYERLHERYRERGIRFKEKKEGFRDELCKRVGDDIRNIRKEKELSQRILAEKLGVSQQLISRIEQGKENISLITLKNIFNALGKKIKIGLL